MGRYKKLTVDTMLFTVSSFGSKFLTLLLTPLYTAVLSTEEYGVADLIITTIDFIYPVLTLMISDAALRFAFDEDKKKSGVLNASFLFVFASTLLLILATPLVGYLSVELSKLWTIFVVTYLFFNLHSCVGNFAKGLGKTKLFAFSGIVHTLAVVASNLYFLLVLKQGLNGYLYSIAIGYFVSFLTLYFGAGLYRCVLPFGVDKKLLREMLKYSVPMIPTVVAWLGSAALNKYMIIYFCGYSENGLFSVAHKIPSIVVTFTLLFSQAWQLSAIDNYGKEGYDRFFSQVCRAFNLLIVISVVGFLPFVKPLASVLFAKEYYSAWTVVSFLLLSSLFSSLSSFLAAAFRASKNTNGLVKSVAIGALVNVILNLALIQFIGIRGAAIAAAAAFACTWAFRYKDALAIVKLDLSLPSVVATYALLFVLATWHSFDLPYFAAVYVVLFAAILFLNRRDLKNLSEKLRQAATKKLARRRA